MMDTSVTQGRWFKSNDGTLFIAIDDLITDYKSLQKDNLNPPIEIIIAGLEASKEIAESLSINNSKANDQK